jgi:hypothetical protein
MAKQLVLVDDVVIKNAASITATRRRRVDRRVAETRPTGRAVTDLRDYLEHVADRLDDNRFAAALTAPRRAEQ